MLVANIRVDEAISADGLNLTYATTSADQFENVRVSINGLLLDSLTQLLLQLARQLKALSL